MKSEKGITLISLIVYVIVLTIVVAVIAIVSGFFMKNIKKAPPTQSSKVQHLPAGKLLINTVPRFMILRFVILIKICCRMSLIRSSSAVLPKKTYSPSCALWLIMLMIIILLTKNIRMASTSNTAILLSTVFHLPSRKSQLCGPCLTIGM